MRVFSFLIFSLINIQIVTAQASMSDKRLLEISKKLYDSVVSVVPEGSENQKREVVRNYLVDLTDKEKTQALALWMFHVDEVSGEMRWGTGGAAYAYVRNDPFLISDVSYLRSLLENEKDARRFHLLANLAGQFTYYRDVDFIPQISNMLFRDDQIVKPQRDQDAPWMHDVSLRCYELIVRDLKRFGAQFKPPDKRVPHKERVLILANWLKANWPGCEDLQIPASAERVEKRTPAEPETRPIKREAKKSSEKTLEATSYEEAESNFWWWVGAAVFIAFLLSVPVVRRLRA